MYLGIDLGTSAVKALLLNEHGVVDDSADAALAITRPWDGAAEQSPEDWIRATEEAIQKLRAARPDAFSAIRGIGLSGQMHGATLLDWRDRVIRPCILWNDTRSHVEAAELNADPKTQRITGNICFPGFTAPKLNWCRRNEPHVFDRIAKVLLPKDYLRLWLTGEYASDMSDASGTAWLDIGGRCWSEPLLARSGLETGHMPRLVEGSDLTGEVRSELVARWNIKHPVLVAGGAGDNAAAACGIGAIKGDDAFVSLGTSGVLFAATAGFRPNPNSAVHAFCHALPGRWHQMGVILAAADALNWLAYLLNVSVAEIAELAVDGDGPGGVTFTPYLGGERTPHNDAHVRAAFVGLSATTTRADLARAVLDGVSFAFRDSLEALKDADTQVSRVIALGGGSRSSFWLTSLAAALGVTIDVPAAGDFGAAFGAARLALIATTGSKPETVCTTPAITKSIEADLALRDRYDDAYRKYRDLYVPLAAYGSAHKTGS